MLLLLDSAPALSTLAMVFAVSAAVVGAGLGLVRLRGDTNQSAVIQAQGAMETMVQLQDELEKALARERRDHATCREQLEAAKARYDRAVAHWGPFPNGDDDATSSY